MTAPFTLTYLVTTRNKLPMLREVMARLLANLQADEEVIVIDAASTDGTVEYLGDLHRSGRIHQFVSEADQGEAHGYNKGLLRARGELIKIITDDDAFHYPAIQACKRFLLGHPEVDLLGTDGSAADWRRESPFYRTGQRHAYERYQAHRSEFDFTGLGLMLRRSSLAVTGLFDLRFLRVDFEFSLRTTSGPANLAWYTGCTWLRLENRASNSVTAHKRALADWIRLNRYYVVIHREPTHRELIRDAVRSLLRPIKRKFFPGQPHESTVAGAKYPEEGEWAQVFARCEAWLAEVNQTHPGEFLTR